MEKPRKKTREYYCFSECMEYLQKLYNFDYRDIDGFDFWSWLVDEWFVTNSCFSTLEPEREDDYPEKVEIIFRMFETHFGEHAEYYFGW